MTLTKFRQILSAAGNDTLAPHSLKFWGDTLRNLSLHKPHLHTVWHPDGTTRLASLYAVVRHKPNKLGLTQTRYWNATTFRPEFPVSAHKSNPWLCSVPQTTNPTSPE